jgi:hypothetical protein
MLMLQLRLYECNARRCNSVMGASTPGEVLRWPAKVRMGPLLDARPHSEVIWSTGMRCTCISKPTRLPALPSQTILSPRKGPSQGEAHSGTYHSACVQLRPHRPAAGARSGAGPLRCTCHCAPQSGHVRPVQMPASDVSQGGKG